MTAFWNKHELSQMHIELTNACNAACPMCVRFYNNSPLVRPDLEIGQITIEQFRKWFSPDIIKKCNLILFCGVHGDPCVARDMLEICEYIMDSSDTTAVRVNTNGGMRRADWWHKLGSLFAKRNKRSGYNYWQVTFSIDGLEDTNHMYRRNVDWKVLEKNVRAYISEGASASWDFLIFKHNEHQIEAAEKLAKEIGFDEFIPKKALGVDDGTNLKPMPVMDKEGKLAYIIEAPTQAKNRNLENSNCDLPVKFYPFKYEDYKNLKANKQIGKDFQQQVDAVYDRILTEDNTKFNNCKINCKSKTWQGGKEIFVDNFGRVMPCCYIGTHLNGIYTDTRTLQLHKHMNDYGWEHFSLEKYSLEEILDNEHLDRVFADSWSRDRVEEGRLSYCADTCGTLSSIDKIFSHEKLKGNVRFKKFNEK